MNTKIELSDFDKKILDRITKEVALYDIHWENDKKIKHSTFHQIENEELRNSLIDNYEGAWTDEDGYYHPDATYTQEQEEEKEQHNQLELMYIEKLNKKFN